MVQTSEVARGVADAPVVALVDARVLENRPRETVDAADRLAPLADLVDGVVARHHGTESNFGAFLDSTLDRLVDMAVLMGVLMFYARAGEPMLVLLVGWVLVAGVMVSYAKARAERFVDHFEGGIMERAERMGLVALGGLVGFMQPMLWIVAIGSTITVVQRFGLAYRAMNALPAAPEHPAEQPTTGVF